MTQDELNKAKIEIDLIEAKSKENGLLYSFLNKVDKPFMSITLVTQKSLLKLQDI